MTYKLVKQLVIIREKWDTEQGVAKGMLSRLIRTLQEERLNQYETK